MPSPLDAADTQAEQLRRIEDAARARAVGRLAGQLAALTRMAAGGAVVSPGAWQAILDRLVALLTPVAPRAQQVLVEAMGKAWANGLKHADLAGTLSVGPPQFEPDVERIVADQINAVRVLLTSNEQIVPALEVAKRTLTRVEASVAWNVHRTAAEATEAAAQELGWVRVWRAERDACLSCLAYQGETAQPGMPFRGGLTFGDRPVGRDPVPNPPLHVHCRCTLAVLHPADTFAVTALKREARRSVAKGWSLPSESEPERLRAADRLLAHGAGLPQSVEDQARRAVKRGHFNTRRAPAG